jgi:hypothetical protein
MKHSHSLLLWFALTHVAVSAGAEIPTSPASEASRLSTTSSTPEGDTRVRRAQSHFRSGVDLYEERNYDGALAEFFRAHELVPNYRVLYNLAQTQAERHDYVDAIRLFDEYLEHGGSEIPAPRRAATEEERDSLLERVASVRIESNVEGAELWVEGRARGLVPKSHTLQLNAGMADVRLEKPGYEPASRQLSIVGGDSVVVQMRLARRTAAEAVARPSGASKAGRRQVEGGANTELWLSAGATTLLAGVTATFAVLATRENAELDRGLRQHQADRARLDDTRSRVRSSAALTDGFGAATIVGLGATLFFLISGSDEEATFADRADRVRVLIGSSGVSLRKDF